MVVASETKKYNQSNALYIIFQKTSLIFFVSSIIFIFFWGGGGNLQLKHCLIVNSHAIHTMHANIIQVT